jgi:hypothetical protein
MRFSDPSGHDPLDSAWESQWNKEHPGQTLTDEARQQRLLSLIIPGSGPDGAWTSDDWKAFQSNSRAVADRNRLPGESGTAQFKRYLGQLAKSYKPGEGGLYVRAVAQLFGGVPYSSNPYTATTSDIEFLDLDPSGMSSQYSSGGDNQTHHYAAFLARGYYYGGSSAAVQNFFRETQQALGRLWHGQSYYYDPGDVALGTDAAMAGYGLSLADNGQPRALDFLTVAQSLGNELLGP